MNHLCRWCKKPIDPTRHPSVTNRVPLQNGETFTQRFHAKGCYPAWREFLRLHEFQPLDPEVHDHE